MRPHRSDRFDPIQRPLRHCLDSLRSRREEPHGERENSVQHQKVRAFTVSEEPICHPAPIARAGLPLAYAPPPRRGMPKETPCEDAEEIVRHPARRVRRSARRATVPSSSIFAPSIYWPLRMPQAGNASLMRHSLHLAKHGETARARTFRARHAVAEEFGDNPGDSAAARQRRARGVRNAGMVDQWFRASRPPRWRLRLFIVCPGVRKETTQCFATF